MNRLTLFLLSVVAVTTLSAQKYVGGDISMLPKYEEKKAKYYDKDGQLISDVLLFMKEQGMNAMRVRLFVDPSKAPDEHKGEGVCQDLPYVKDLGKRIKDAGLAFLLDLHYSDTWTDPGKHSTPSSWTATTAEELAQTLYDYTVSTLTELKEYGAEPDFIQVGNEITYGQLWPTGHVYPGGGGYVTGNVTGSWDSFYLYIKKGTEACREVCPDAKVVIHVEMSGQGKNVLPFFNTLKNYNPDYDIIGLSYYPYYHGDLSKLENLLGQLRYYYPAKKVQLVEAGYPHAYYPTGDKIFDYTATYPGDTEGQRQFTADLIEKLNKYENVDGLYWWWPEANEKGVNWQNPVTKSGWYNYGLWDNATGKAQTALYELKNFRDDLSGISEVTSGQQPGKDNRYYNLAGQQIAKPSNGVYVYQGRKYVRTER